MNPDLTPLLDQLDELRRRLIIAGGAWLAAFLVCYAWSGELFHWLARPVRAALPENSSLVFLTATEPFFTHLKISAVAGLVAALPVILWQVWRFVAPALKMQRTGLGFPLLFVAAAYLAFLAGAGFGFVYVFPLIVSVLVRFGTEGGAMNAMLSMSDYLSLATAMLLAFGAVFELPLVILLLARLGIVDHHQLRRNRKYMVIVAFVFGAVITPGPDVLSQASIAVPFVILYEVGILAARLFGKPRRQRTQDAVQSASP